MYSQITHRSRSIQAFTLAEMLVAAAASVFLASIIYTAGSEMLVSFARNISINRSYSDARIALERMAETIEAAGHTPVLINADGLTLATTSPAAGIRFYRLTSQPVFAIPSGSSNDTTLKITLPTKVGAPSVGDLITIPVIGFQGLVTAVTASGTQATLTFGGSTIASNCVPALTTAYQFGSASTTVPATSQANGNAITVGNTTITTTAYTYTTTSSCLQFTQAAFVAVGTQLRYYPRAATTTTAFNTAANYKVIANLVATPANANQLLPFQLGPVSSVGGTSTTISVTLCVEAPDYNKRNLGTADTFAQMQSSLGSRSPLLVRGPY